MRQKKTHIHTSGTQQRKAKKSHKKVDFKRFLLPSKSVCVAVEEIDF